MINNFELFVNEILSNKNDNTEYYIPKTSWFEDIGYDIPLITDIISANVGKNIKTERFFKDDEKSIMVVFNAKSEDLLKIKNNLQKEFKHVHVIEKNW